MLTLKSQGTKLLSISFEPLQLLTKEDLWKATMFNLQIVSSIVGTPNWTSTKGGVKSFLVFCLIRRLILNRVWSLFGIEGCCHRCHRAYPGFTWLQLVQAQDLLAPLLGSFPLLIFFFWYSSSPLLLCGLKICCLSKQPNYSFVVALFIFCSQILLYFPYQSWITML